MKITRKELKELIAESIKDSKSVLLEFPVPGSAPRMGPNAPEHEKDPDGVEGSMARKSLYHMSAQATQLHSMLADDENLEPWVQDKITKAADYLESVFKHVTYDKQNPAGR
jgi:hypothetical protein